MKKYDLVVVGSGAGFIVLDAALERGLSCALVEKDQFGGTCLNRGCIPSKMLVYPADLIREAERAPKLGVDLGKPKVDWQRLGERMFEKINMNKYIREEYLNTPNLDVYEGTAAFVDEHTMQVTLKDGTVSPPFAAQRFVLAGGARSRRPQIEGLSTINPVTYETFFGPRFPKKPWKSLTIIGGGIIATEFAHIFSAMGTQVTIIGRAPQLLRGEDPEVSEFLAEQYRAFGIRLLLAHTAVKAQMAGSKKRVTAQCVQTGRQVDVDSEEVLVASGVVSNADLLNLRAAKVDIDENNWIKTNEYMETNQPHIYALGDINGRFAFRHKANHEAEVLAHNLYADAERRRVDYSKVPWAVFSFPQVARVGLTEQQAVEAGHKVFVGRNYYSQVASGYAMGYNEGDADDGFVKVIVDEHGTLLGVHIVGFQAATLVQPYVYLMNAASLPRAQDGHMHVDVGTFEPVTRSMTIHPALSELTAWAFDHIDWLNPVAGIDLQDK